MIDENEISKKVEGLFESGTDDDGMWKTFSKFAAQYDSLQILALTKLTYVANICSDDVKKRLMDFIEHYRLLHNNRNTAEFMLKMNEMQALKSYFTGIQAQVKVDK